MRARVLALAVTIALACAAGERLRAQPRPGANPEATIAAVRAYYEQELPIGWRVREVQLTQDGRGANVYVEAPFWTIGDMNAQARDVCPGTEAYLWRAVLFVTVSATRRGISGTGVARCSAVGRRE
jgi:hypothetical protein